MLLRLALRGLTRVSPRLAIKAGYLWVWKGMRAMRAYKRRVKRGELFPPFLFLALTDACNLTCRGCWMHGASEHRQLSLEDVAGVIREGKKQGANFYTLLGGEPMIYPGLWEILETNRDCYFQIITNGMFHTEENVARIRRLGNVTPLVSLDGPKEVNDARRGEGCFEAASEGMARLKAKKILFGVATTVTGENFEQVVCDEYVRRIIDAGAMYLWFYVYRPVGVDPAPHLCVSGERLVELRRRMLTMRRKHPIILIDTYWDAKGEAVCPAARGLGFHIGPGGAIEPCPPMSLAADNIRDNDGDLAKTIGQSGYLRGFQKFVDDRTRGCVILECPGELVDYAQSKGAKDTSGRDIESEFRAAEPRTSHHLPGEEIPEDFWFYRMLKKRLFFGMGGYG